MILGYVRVSTDKQTVDNQKSEILKYCNGSSVKGKVEWLEVTMSTRKSERDRRLNELFDRIKSSDTVIVSEMSRLGRSTQEVLQTIDKLMNHKVELHIVKQKLVVNPNNKNDFISKSMITLMSLFAELERDLISQRTKEALSARKASGVTLGKPKGTVQQSKYDEHKDRILELKELGLSLNKIVKNHLEPIMGKGNCSVQSLSTYLKKRGFK